MKYSLPYEQLFDLLITKSCALFLKALELRMPISMSHQEINSHFHELQKKVYRGRDPHVFADGFRGREAPSHPTRLSKLFKQALHGISLDEGQVQIPSPLKFICDLLTVPAEPASRAFALATIRQFLFDHFRVRVSDGRGLPNSYSEITQQDIEEIHRSAETYIEHRDNPRWGRIELTGKVVGNYLAARGIWNLHFTGSDAIEKARRFCSQMSFDPWPEDARTRLFAFKRAPGFRMLPPATELINELWGAPLPLRGFETVFFGGLKFSSQRGLVASVTGLPGTGKTSFALSMAVGLGAVGATTLYLTSEEDPRDLSIRLSTLTPGYLRDLSFFEHDTEAWFRAIDVSPTDLGDESDGPTLLKEVIENLKSAIGDSATTHKQSRNLYSPCPWVVVLDGIQSYFRRKTDDQGYTLEGLVKDCRALGGLVLLVHSDDQEKLANLDYLVDVIVRLEHRHVDIRQQKPARIFMLRKTRHQVSRPGAHIFHLSGPDGFRIAPQIPSQLDKRSIHEDTKPDEHRYIDVFNRALRYHEYQDLLRRPKESKLRYRFEQNRWLRIFPRSHILIHGRGSAGKAGLGLKLLQAPTFKFVRDAQMKGRYEGTIERIKNKILVISFLYSEDYYAELALMLDRVLRSEYREDIQQYMRYARRTSLPVPGRAAVHVKKFFPGFLGPEDFFSKITRTLEEADLNGEPFSGVLLDGMHNVFLQFPILQQDSAVWPMLYSYLRTRDLTVITTSTTFTFGGPIEPKHLTTAELEGYRPFLNALVQASDFYFETEEAPHADENVDVSASGMAVPDGKLSQRKYMIRAVSAIGQKIPNTPVMWDRERLVVYRDVGPRQEEMKLEGEQGDNGKGPTIA